MAAGALLTDDDAGARAGDRGTRRSISMSFLVLLESLTPLERAVFLLHEVFGYGYEEVAGIVGRRRALSAAAIRAAGSSRSAGRDSISADPRAGWLRRGSSRAAQAETSTS